MSKHSTFQHTQHEHNKNANDRYTAYWHIDMTISRCTLGGGIAHKMSKWDSVGMARHTQNDITGRKVQL